MNRDILGLAIIAAIAAFWWVCDYCCKRERQSHARRAAERGRK